MPRHNDTQENRDQTVIMGNLLWRVERPPLQIYTTLNFSLTEEGY